VAAFVVLTHVAAHAQQPSPTLGQLAHRRWTTRDGAPSVIVALAQSADGFLWIGSSTGLYRFDGVRFERFEPPAGQTMLSAGIQTLSATPDGSLLIGYNAGGISVLTGGRLTHHRVSDGVPSGSVMGLTRDAVGAVWVGTSFGLGRQVNGKWERIGAKHGYPGGVTAHLLIDRRETLWAAETTGVFVLRRGADKFVRWAPTLDGPGGRTGHIQEAPDGTIWGQSPWLGLVRLTDATGQSPVVGWSSRPDTKGFYYAMIDRHADAWLYARDEGVPFIRIPLGSVAAELRLAAPSQALTAAQAASSSGKTTMAMLEDREGTIWAGTDGGLDQFRATRMTRVEWPGPLLMPALAAGDDGVVWMGSSSDALTEIRDPVIQHPGVPKGVSCAYRDPEGGVWFGGLDGLWRQRANRLERVDLPAELGVNSCQALALDRAGVLWMSLGGPSARGVFRLRRGAWERFEPPTGAAPGFPLVITSDVAGRTWLGYNDDRLVLITADASQVFTPADGLHVGHVKAIHVRGPHVWIGGESGVMLLIGGRFQRLVPAEGTVDRVTGIVETAAGDLWVNGADGVTRVPVSEIRRAAQQVDYRVRVERFDFRDGIDGAPHPLRPLPSIIEGTDGRLWFSSFAGVTWLDPQHPRRNTVRPDVHIHSLEANGQRYSQAVRVDLSPGTRALTIAYTATSLAVPERVRFRYQLVGSDTAWQDAGTRREAFYTNLDPGAYRFRVIAANDDGVWNEQGAALDIVIPATFTQSNAFLALCVLATAGTILLLAAWRQRRVAAGIRARFDAALTERTRIAQELHDTLLQSFTGIALQLHGALRLLGTRPAEAELMLRDAVATADASVREARHLVSDMRAPELEAADLRDALAAVGREAIKRRPAGTEPIAFEIVVRGDRRRLPHRIEVTALRIGREAILNAVRHATAHTLEVALDFESDVLRMRVRDDGRGVTPSVMASAGSDGHWGIVGMLERAASVGGTIDLAPAPGGGTLVSVTLPTTGT
jgi:signal transduction histidine kinase/ligand-binding sensor domain-containing protein